MNDRETRCYSGEVRAEQYDNAPTHILGYGSVFNSRSEPLWGFREIIKPGAFDDVLNDDVRGLFNHDPNFILGRSSAGTLSLWHCCKVSDEAAFCLIQRPYISKTLLTRR
ncbi:TPA: HK97 family phage prohead protease, partial [Escherichia coli]